MAKATKPKPSVTTATVTPETTTPTKVFDTIHIFGFGVAQAITSDKNVQTQVSNVQSMVDSCVANILSKKPADFTGTDYHAINVFSDMRCTWLGKGKGENFNVEYKDLDASLFEALANAVLATETQPA